MFCVKQGSPIDQSPGQTVIRLNLRAEPELRPAHSHANRAAMNSSSRWSRVPSDRGGGGGDGGDGDVVDILGTLEIDDG